MSADYFKVIDNQIIIRNTIPEDAIHLERLQDLIFPTLSSDELLRAHHYLKHLELFPEGQFAVLDGEKRIGMSTTIRYHLTTEDHTFLEISAGLWMTTHEPEGDWMYGMDVGVLPEYRGRGIARAIYRARQETCRKLGLKGQITAGMTNGYHRYADMMTIDVYYEALLAGSLTDPTVTAQQKLGFEHVRLQKDYLDDPTCGNAAAIMILPVEKEV